VRALARLARLADDADSSVAVSPGGRPAMLDASVPHLLALAARACAEVALQERAAGSATGFSRIATEQLAASLRRAQRRPVFAAAWAGDLAMAHAELERVAGDPADRARRWKAALEHLAERPYPAAYAYWRLAEAQLARREGRAAAMPSIEQGLARAASLGARRLSEELHGLARRARLTVAVATDTSGPSVSMHGDQRPFGLTAREAEVLTLVADGLSNQQIAERLFISPKTASVHVSNIYAKLGVESRVAAATTAHDLGFSSAGASTLE
jgi:DNA-binding CsgD family transcriptional regulator